jgi:tRNA-splicing ligase RtcB (3'-phosphate/5'-hydroxy nucleic acid ligase)
MNSNIVVTTHSEALSTLFHPDSPEKSVTVIGTDPIRKGFDELCLKQALNSRHAPGITDLILNPDAHGGYGAPVGCVMVSPTHIYPGPVGVDIKCSMSLLQMNIPSEELNSKGVRRQIIDALLKRLPTGAGKGARSVKKGRYIDYSLGRDAVIYGASEKVCSELGIPFHWTRSCEDSFHTGHDKTSVSLENRFDLHEKNVSVSFFSDKFSQLGSYGGGNHFGEANIVRVEAGAEDIANEFGLRDGDVSFLSHCGSRGFGYYLAKEQFKTLQGKFAISGTPYPGGDKELVYALLGTPEAGAYLDDMALGSNFATVNHMLINTLVLEAFQEIFPGAKGDLIYFISHNIAREENVNGKASLVHRKGATRAFPKGHEALKGTRYENTGHPILLPGNPAAGSAVMVAKEGAAVSCYSVNHGAGRAMSRRRAIKELSQSEIDAQFYEKDILSNCRTYPRDEAPDAYKDFHEVLRSVTTAGLARMVATLSARFVIKDGDRSNDGAA